ncbi:MAG: AAA family ATPase [Bacteroidales bacterium]|jgi:ABC-type cobalamin/Fe3+-siderophores transport system ATPase subunit|nr:AAA family ATPase [Bacteroidales bacterium]
MAKIKIERIEVKGLFGYFTYDIKKASSTDEKLLLLYGDNGSGKTTILKTIFYLLSCQDGAGHKTELAKTKFEKVIVHLDNGISIGAIRKNNLIGAYSYVIQANSKDKYKITLKGEDDLDTTIRLDKETKEGIYYLQMLKFISQLNIKLFFLSDTRKTMNSGVVNLFQRELEKSMEFSSEVYESRVIRRRIHPEEADPIEITIKALENWIKSKALIASKAGDRQTNNIYHEIVNQITNTEFTGGKDISSKIQIFQELLLEVNKRTNSHAKYGLITKSEYSQINKSLEAVSDQKKEIIYNVIEPFIRGIKAKLDAQEKLQILLSTFIEQLNSFFTNKRISYTLSDGFRISQKETKEKIDFPNLSSGEKQLLLLFSNTILASSQATIFIIDEPEISLNIKWQRKLLETLISFSSNDGVQFLIATHSIELLTSKKKNVVKLENIK